MHRSHTVRLQAALLCKTGHESLYSTPIHLLHYLHVIGRMRVPFLNYSTCIYYNLGFSSRRMYH